MWRIFEELRECPKDSGYSSHLSSFEKNREEVQAAMALTVSTGSDLIAKLRIRKTDVHAEVCFLPFSHWFIFSIRSILIG